MRRAPVFCPDFQDVIFTSLASDAAVESVITEMLEAARSSREALRPGKSTVFCETSTVYPDLTTKLEALVAGTGPGFHYCAALPFGQPPVAKAAQLVFAIAGKREARDAVEDLIVPHMGRQVSRPLSRSAGMESRSRSKRDIGAAD